MFESASNIVNELIIQLKYNTNKTNGTDFKHLCNFHTIFYVILFQTLANFTNWNVVVEFREYFKNQHIFLPFTFFYFLSTTMGYENVVWSLYSHINAAG